MAVAPTLDPKKVASELLNIIGRDFKSYFSISAITYIPVSPTAWGYALHHNGKVARVSVELPTDEKTLQFVACALWEGVVDA